MFYYSEPDKACTAWHEELDRRSRGLRSRGTALADGLKIVCLNCWPWPLP